MTARIFWRASSPLSLKAWPMERPGSAIQMNHIAAAEQLANRSAAPECGGKNPASTAYGELLLDLWGRFGL